MTGLNSPRSKKKEIGDVFGSPLELSNSSLDQNMQTMHGHTIINQTSFAGIKGQIIYRTNRSSQVQVRKSEMVKQGM